jgi:hypothetical protein
MHSGLLVVNVPHELRHLLRQHVLQVQLVVHNVLSERQAVDIGLLLLGRVQGPRVEILGLRIRDNRKAVCDRLFDLRSHRP